MGLTATRALTVVRMERQMGAVRDSVQLLLGSGSEPMIDGFGDALGNTLQHASIGPLSRVEEDRILEVFVEVFIEHLHDSGVKDDDIRFVVVTKRTLIEVCRSD